jgi:tRNA (adenine57-N1/adenine58-N1)-methyltransferase catalytic subunit
MASQTQPPPGISPFLEPGPGTKVNSLAILQLARDNFSPVYLQEAKGEVDGYAEGAVINTRYGSFPHSTLIGVPWGSQIRASKVDTGSRGRKRKRPDEDEKGRQENGNAENDDNAKETPKPEGSGASTPKQVEVASSGFIHILPPTPELWTSSLPHRTQVVYTPDYSYILQRIRARPGSRLIEAGAGSGSFTHASARAVYNGYPRESNSEAKGKVFSFEFNKERHAKMQEEIAQHGLERLVQLTHRDVYKDGFLLDGKSPEVDAVFLDLPAPWEALPHLSRRRPARSASASNGKAADETNDTGKSEEAWVSPLNPRRSVYICTFSPCIEQVTRTVSTMRRLGWLDIEMVEIVHRKLHAARDRIGLNLPVEKGVNATAHDVEEALAKLVEVEERNRERAARLKEERKDGDGSEEGPGNGAEAVVEPRNGSKSNWKAPTSASTTPTVPAFRDGRLIVRGEPEIKTHTSYLVFAILPREWSEEDEAAALAKWQVGKEKGVVGKQDKQGRRQEVLEKFKRPSVRKDKEVEKSRHMAKAEAMDMDVDEQ